MLEASFWINAKLHQTYSKYLWKENLLSIESRDHIKNNFVHGYCNETGLKSQKNEITTSKEEPTDLQMPGSDEEEQTQTYIVIRTVIHSYHYLFSILQNDLLHFQILEDIPKPKNSKK